MNYIIRAMSEKHRTPLIVFLANHYSSKRQPDWNLFALAATIEVERHRKTNPPLLEWLRDDYKKAWNRLADLAMDSLRDRPDSDMLQSSLAVIAIARSLKIGALLILLDPSELDEILERYLDWPSLYADTVS